MRRRVAVWARAAVPGWVALCALVLGVFVGAVGEHLRAHWLHWRLSFGDVPTWTGSLGAIVAAVYAARAFAGQRKEVEELARNGAMADRMLRYQAHLASRVFASAVDTGWETKQMVAGEGALVDELRVGGHVHNESDGVILDVVVRIRLDLDPLASIRFRRETRSELGSWIAQGTASPTDLVRVDALRPGEGIRWFRSIEGVVDASRITVDVRFTDELETRWELGRNKKPLEADDAW